MSISSYRGTVLLATRLESGTSRVTWNTSMVRLAKTVAADLEGARPLLDKVCKCRLKLARLTCVRDQKAHPPRAGRDLHLSRFGLCVDRVCRVAEITNRRCLRYQFQQQP